MDYASLLRELETLLCETYSLWDPGWVTFNWRGYTYDHVNRVRGLAVTLCKQEGGDALVVELAGLLHDVTKPYDGEYITGPDGQRIVDERGYWQNEVRRPPRSNEVTRLYEELGLQGQLHNESGATLAEHLLRSRGVPCTVSTRVAQTIRDHLRPSQDAPLESKCLYDADTIDANIGLPAFVRNIYINLHFHDRRKEPGTPPIATLLRDSPLDFLQPYVGENLPRWVAGKRRDFTPRLLTASARRLAVARFERLEGVFGCLSQNLRDGQDTSRRNCLDVVRHFVERRDDPSIADEADSLACDGSSSGRTHEAQSFVEHLQREIAGTE